MMLKISNYKISRAIIFSILLIFVIGARDAGARTYESKDCPVKFNVPSDLELRDVFGWTEPVEQISCRISVVRKGKRNIPLPEKSFDDVRYLSDVVLEVRNIPVRSRFPEFNFASSNDHVAYKGKMLSSDAIDMGYEIVQVRPIEYYAVGHGEMYVGTQDFTRRYREQRKAIRSTSYVFLLGNERFSIDVVLTYIDSGSYGQIKKNSILKLLRSAKFGSGRENAGSSTVHE
jgi:hypothetical protein